jgi:hypothetical protein
MPNESEPYVTTDGQSASLSWNKAPIWGLRPDFYCSQTATDFLMWGALSDERTGLSFTIAAGPRQRSPSRVLVPWDSRPYFTVSDSRLSFLSPPTTRRAMVEVFDTTSTRDDDAKWLNFPELNKLPGEPNISQHVLQFLRYSSASVATGTCLPNRCPAMDYSVATRCSANMVTEPLPSNCHIRHNMLAIVKL